MTEIIPNREVKDTLFKWIFQEKENAVKLVKALTGREYKEEDVTIYTLEDVLYINIKNDVSIVVKGGLYFFEHQSTPNPNIPLRCLDYFAQEISVYIEEHELNVYSSRIQKIPKPYFYVFYNGREDLEEIKELRLSDMFLRKDEKETMELIVTMYNINSGKNKELKEACRPLEEYAWMTNTIKEKRKQGSSTTEAIEGMLKDMPKDFKVYDKIQAHKLGVIKMLETEFDEEKFKRLFKKEGKQ